MPISLFKIEKNPNIRFNGVYVSLRTDMSLYLEMFGGPRFVFHQIGGDGAMGKKRNIVAEG